MKKIIIVTIVLLFGVAAAAYLYFEKLNNNNLNNDNALKTAIQSSFLTISFTNEPTFFEVMQDYPLFNQLIGEDKKNELAAIQNLIVKNDKLNKWITNRKIFASLVPDGKNNFDLLFIVQLNQNADVDRLLREMNTEGTKATIVDEQFKIEGQLSEVFYGMVKNNTAIVSKNADLVRNIVNNKLNPLDPNSQEFLENYRNVSKNSLAQMYINTQKSDVLYKTLLVNKPNNLLQEWSKVQAFSVMNFNYGKNKLQFSGATLSLSKHHYFQSFMTQEAQKITIPDLLPASTAFYSIYTISDFQSWQKELVKNMQNNQRFIKKRKSVLGQMNPDDSVRLFKDFAALNIKEFSYVELNTNEKIALIAYNGENKIDTLLNTWTQSGSDSTYRFRKSGILPALFGGVFGDFNQPYIQKHGNYLLISNATSTLKKIKDSTDLLVNTQNYIDFSAQIIPEANISYFVNNMEYKTQLKKAIRWDLYQYYIPDKSPYHRIYGMGIQLSAENQTFQTTVTITNRIDRTNFN